MKRNLLTYSSAARNVNFYDLGIPLEVFRKKRAMGRQEKNMHFNIFTIKMLKSSGAFKWLESLADEESDGYKRL